MTQEQVYTVQLEPKKVSKLANSYGYPSHTETTFQFNLPDLLEFMTTYSTEFTKLGIDHQKLDTRINGNHIDLRDQD